MQRIASLLVGGAVLAGHALGAGAAPCPPLVVWQPRGAGQPAANVRAQLGREAQARGCRLIDATADLPRDPPSLAEALAAALADYRAFKFVDAVAKLERVAAAAQATGGGDLDAHQLAELYLYRGLSRSELAQSDAAWDDFVRAARLDPARVLDPAQFPPRAVAAYRRAAADAAARPPASVRVVAPAGARVRLDGRDATGAIAVPLGSHLLRVQADGFQPFGGVVEVTATDERIAPPLVALRAPPPEQLLALAGGAPALVAVVEASPWLGSSSSGPAWRLALRAVATDGNARALERAIDADSAAPVASALLHQLLDTPAPSLVTAPGAIAARPSRTRRLPAWSWGLIGGVVVTLGIVVPIVVVYAPPTPQGTIGGAIGPLK